MRISYDMKPAWHNAAQHADKPLSQSSTKAVNKWLAHVCFRLLLPSSFVSLQVFSCTRETTAALSDCTMFHFTASQLCNNYSMCSMCVCVCLKS